MCCPSLFSSGIPVDFAPFLYGYLPFRSFPPSWWGPTLRVFPWRPPSPFLWFIRGVEWSSWLSPLPVAWLWFVVFHSSLWWGFGYLPCVLTLDLSLVSWLFHCFFPRGFVSVCFHFLYAFMFPCQWTRPGLLLLGSRGAAASSSTGCSLWLLVTDLVLLLRASSSSSPRVMHLVSVSWDVFSGPLVCLGFFSLVILSFLSVGLRPVFGLELFLGFLSFGSWSSWFSLPLAVFCVSQRCLCSVLFRGIFWIGCFRSPSSSVVFRHLLLLVGLLCVGRPIIFLFSVSLFW